MNERTITEAKADLMAKIKQGAHCPCCGQFTKQYQRRITGAMAYGLLLLARHQRSQPPGYWIHVENYLKALPNITSAIRGDITKLTLWGLLDRQPGKRDDGSVRVGFYRVSDKGWQFIRREIALPKLAVVFNGELLRFEGGEVKIDACMGRKFNYAGLMKWVENAQEKDPQQGELL